MLTPAREIASKRVNEKATPNISDGKHISNTGLATTHVYIPF